MSLSFFSTFCPSFMFTYSHHRDSVSFVVISFSSLAWVHSSFLAFRHSRHATCSLLLQPYIPSFFVSWFLVYFLPTFSIPSLPQWFIASFSLPLVLCSVSISHSIIASSITPYYTCTSPSSLTYFRHLCICFHCCVVCQIQWFYLWYPESGKMFHCKWDFSV